MTIMACRLATAIAVVGTLTVAMTSGSFAAPSTAPTVRQTGRRSVTSTAPTATLPLPGCIAPHVSGS